MHIDKNINILYASLFQQDHTIENPMYKTFFQDIQVLIGNHTKANWTLHFFAYFRQFYHNKSTRKKKKKKY